MALLSKKQQMSAQLDAILANQGLILAALTAIQKELQKMALSLAALQAAVASETTVEQSAITLIQGLATQITTLIAASGNSVDPVALQAIVTQMTTSQAALAAAVAANTTATPPPPGP
jgi:hypothetical protein